MQRFANVQQLEAQLTQANKRAVGTLGLYADWCVSCKVMEKLCLLKPMYKKH